jgi:diguanylate cyclase (GGDEF)-like protein
MISCQVEGEKERLEALYRMELLDTPPEQAFDRITRLAKSVLGTPIALVSLIDADRQWFKSKQGLEANQTPRDIAFCNHTICRSEPMVVEDARLDERFADNPLVVGEPGIRFYAGAPLRTRDGHNIGTLCTIDLQPRTISSQQLAVLEDLARLVVDEMELRLIATTDSLTGAMTRRALFDSVKRDLARAKRNDFRLTCVVLDIDHFKSINDNFGHAAGDLVLQNVVAVCQRNLRPSDYLGRIGGEEFVIILQDTDKEASIEVVQRLRRDVEKLVTEFSGKSLQVTASFGIANLSRDISSFEDLLKMADDALYVAKGSGRNRVVDSSKIKDTFCAA